MTLIKRNTWDIASLWLVVAASALGPLITLPLGFYLLSADGSFITGLVILVIGAGLLWLFVHVLREALAQTQTRIAIQDGAVHLRLPARRGFAELAPVSETVPRAAISAIQARTEAFRSGGATTQAAFALVLEDGRRIVLGADRPTLAPLFRQAAEAIAAETRLPIRDLGVVDGDGGFLLLGGVRVPDWESAALPGEIGAKRVADAARVWRWTIAIVGVSLVVSVALRLLAR